MIRYVLRRSLWSVVIVAVVLTLVFNLLFGIGDPAVATLGAKAQKEQLDAFRKRYGLDRSLSEQFTSYVGITPCIRRSSPSFGTGRCGLLQGDLGESLIHGESVTRVILRRLPRTILLGAMALLLELALGMTAGVLAAVYRGRWVDTALMGAAFLGISAPTFLTGLIFLNWWAFRAGLFPVGGYGVTPFEHLQHVMLPAFTLAIMGAATYARIVRSEAIETLRSDFVRTARAKGLSPTRVLWAHGVRNSLVPIVTLMGLQLATLVSGAVITETIYAWPGIGRLAIEAIYNLDAFTVLGVVLMACVAVQAGNLLADVAVAALDPRVRLHR